MVVSKLDIESTLLEWMKSKEYVTEQAAEEFASAVFAGLKTISLEFEALQSASHETQEAAELEEPRNQ